MQGKVIFLSIYCVQSNFDLDNLAFFAVWAHGYCYWFTHAFLPPLRYERIPVTHGTFRVFLSSLISYLARENVKAIAGSEIYRLRDDFSVPG